MTRGKVVVKDPVTKEEWAKKLEQIARRVADTMYDCGGHIGESYNGKKGKLISYDDSDYLRILAKALRGDDGQLSYELGRKTVPWA